jgi:hypothetical protein
MATVSPPSTESQIAVLLGKYTPEIEAQLRHARARLRAKFPRGHELVYDNYNALVFAISPSERTSEAFVSVAGYPKWVTLFFLHGARLDDPTGLLEGEGAQVRSIRLQHPVDILRRHVLFWLVLKQRQDLQSWRGHLQADRMQFVGTFVLGVRHGMALMLGLGRRALVLMHRAREPGGR